MGQIFPTGYKFNDSFYPVSLWVTLLPSYMDASNKYRKNSSIIGKNASFGLHKTHFTFVQLRQYLSQVGIFFNCLVNLNKFIAYEQRDLFALKHQLTEFPDYT